MKVAEIRMRGKSKPMKLPGIVGIPIHWLITIVKHTVHSIQRKSLFLASHHSTRRITTVTILISQPNCFPNPGMIPANKIPGVPGGKFCWNLYTNRIYCMIQSGTRNKPIMDKKKSVIKNHKITNLLRCEAAQIKVNNKTNITIWGCTADSANNIPANSFRFV